MNGGTLRIGVVGTGTIGELHARIFADNPRCELVAVCDADATRARRVAEALGCAAEPDWRGLLARDLDAVSIATPETLRMEPARAAAEKGMKILLEKPLGRSLADVDALVDALVAAGANPAVNFILHADPRFARMKEIVAGGGIGQIATCYARRRGSASGAGKYAPWTDLLSATLIHDIDMCLAVMGGRVERVFAEAVVRRCAQFDCHDAVVATMRFADGAVACLETSWVLPPGWPEPLDPAFHLIGDGGSVVIESSSQGLKVLGTGGYVQPDMTHWPSLAWGVDGALRRSLDIFVDRALSGALPLVGLQAAREAEAVVAAMKQSIECGLPVAPEAPPTRRAAG